MAVKGNSSIVFPQKIEVGAHFQKSIIYIDKLVNIKLKYSCSLAVQSQVGIPVSQATGQHIFPDLTAFGKV